MQSQAYRTTLISEAIEITQEIRSLWMDFHSAEG